MFVVVRAYENSIFETEVHTSVIRVKKNETVNLPTELNPYKNPPFITYIPFNPLPQLVSLTSADSVYQDQTAQNVQSDFGSTLSESKVFFPAKTV